MIGLTRILVPVDFSETSEAALRHAVALARAFKSRLYLLHVPEHPGLAAEAEYPIGLFQTMQNAAHDRLGKLLTTSENELVAARTMRLGKPAEEIIKCAKEQDIDLIVMGTHGRRGLARMLIGSVAEVVVRTAPCPVLTVRGVGPERVADEVRMTASIPA